MKAKDSLDTEQFDISSVKPNTRTVEIKHPGTGEKIGVSVDLMSIDHPGMSEVTRNITNKNVKAHQKGKTIDVDGNRFYMISSAITGWNWYGPKINFKGSKPDFNQKNVKEVLTELPWFADQLHDELSDTASFFINQD